MRQRLALVSSVVAAVGLSSPDPVAANDLVLVMGEPGEERFATSFSAQTKAWKAAAERGGSNLLASIGQESAAPAEGKQAGQESKANTDRNAMNGLLKSLAGTEAEDQDKSPLWLVLIGHGTFDGKTAKFNLRGPDISAPELSSLLEPIKRPVVVIHTGSSSAPFIKELSGPDRIVLTATKSGFEQSYAYFGEYLASAIGSDEADLDNDGGTSLLESFLFASKETAEFFEAEGRIATEQALIDDNGDKKGTPASFFRGIHPAIKPEEGTADGFRAHQLHLVTPKGEEKMTPEMRAERDRLELQVHHLRQKKYEMDEKAYYEKLKPLLLQLARLYAKLESATVEAEGEGDPANAPGGDKENLER